jgi:translation initiation factor IF-2
MVVDGKILRQTKCKLIRGSNTIGEFKLESLKIKSDDQKEVAKGFECGIKLEGCTDIREGDIIECVGQEQLPIIFNGKKYDL